MFLETNASLKSFSVFFTAVCILTKKPVQIGITIRLTLESVFTRSKTPAVIIANAKSACRVETKPRMRLGDNSAMTV